LTEDNNPYLFVTRKFRFQKQSFDIIEFLRLGVRSLLASLNAENNLTHNLEFLPVDARFVLAKESLIAFFGRDEVATVERKERNSLGERIFPGKTIGEMTSLRAHKDDQSHELFLDWDGNQFSSLR
jgi:hypothetical protein